MHTKPPIAIIVNIMPVFIQNVLVSDSWHYIYLENKKWCCQLELWRSRTL